jgi:hypothetical protein
MQSSTDNKQSMFDASWWKGASWLIVLCTLQLITIGVYLLTHSSRHFGYEYVALNTDQQKAFTDLVNIYTDDDKPTSILVRDSAEEAAKPAPDNKTAKDTTKKMLCQKARAVRIQKAGMIKDFLKSTLSGDVKESSGKKAEPKKPTILDDQINELDPVLKELNTKDVISFILKKKFKVDSYFWLAGTSMYWEAIFWSLFGVLTSLIYYVSLANQLALKNKEDDDIGPFDTSEIGSQVAKMFYAPAVTLVLVIGYNYFSDKSQSAIDISFNHGLILFSFMAGFYSGRLMKLLDKLKNSILPDSSDGPSTGDGNTTAAGSGDITITLKLADTMANSPDAPGIIEAGFNTATVTLEPADGRGKTITLDKPTEDQGSGFAAAKVPFGKYTAKASLAFDNKQTVINLSASQDIEVTAAALAFTVPLSQEKTNG